jgi:hypothetical protein
MISSQPTGEAVRERFGLLGEAKSDSKKNSANILMVVEDGCLVSALVEPYAHRAHLIAKIALIQKDFHRAYAELCLPSELEHFRILTSRLNTSSRFGNV